MYSERVVKFKLRRGVRDNAVLKEGELIYTTDIKRCFVGDGQTAGGISFSTINSVTNSSPSNIAVGDLLYHTDLQRTYINASAGLVYIGPYPDDVSITFSDNKLQVAPGGITRSKIYGDVVSPAGGISFDRVNGFSVNHDSTLKVVNNQLVSVMDAAAITGVRVRSDLYAADIALTRATLSSYVGILTADGTFLVLKINNVDQGIRLWTPPLFDIAPPGPKDPPSPPASSEFIIAQDESPVISNVGDNVVWTIASRNYLKTEDIKYIMTEDTDDILWEL